MRFEVTRVLDSIERRLCTDPTVARAVVDLSPIVRQKELDGGRTASLLRLGLVIDALGQSLSDQGAKVYVVLDRALLADLELSSNEKMTLRRWSDDGLVDTLEEVDDRVLEVAACTGLPVISRDDFARFANRHPWLTGAPERFLIPVPGMGGAVLMSRPSPGGQQSAQPVLDAATRAVLA
ncbi:MAG: FHA domain-containing protein, partial [Actinocatenispora sp.]